MKKPIRSEFEFGSMFHTALRKGSDTDWSALLWNGLHVIQSASMKRAEAERVWVQFCGYCGPKFHSGLKVSECAKAWREDSANWTEGFPYIATPEARTLEGLIHLCDDKTWSDVDETVEYWVSGNV